MDKDLDQVLLFAALLTLIFMKPQLIMGGVAANFELPMSQTNEIPYQTE